jgi:hypothetical protein
MNVGDKIVEIMYYIYEIVMDMRNGELIGGRPCQLRQKRLTTEGGVNTMSSIRFSASAQLEHFRIRGS